MKNEPKIEHGLPIPPHGGGRLTGSGKHQVLIKRMKKGDSVLLSKDCYMGMRQTAYKLKAKVCFRKLDADKYRMWLLNNFK